MQKFIKILIFQNLAILVWDRYLTNIQKYSLTSSFQKKEHSWKINDSTNIPLVFILPHCIAMHCENPITNEIKIFVFKWAIKELQNFICKILSICFERACDTKSICFLNANGLRTACGCVRALLRNPFDHATIKWLTKGNSWKEKAGDKALAFARCEMKWSWKTNAHISFSAYSDYILRARGLLNKPRIERSPTFSIVWQLCMSNQYTEIINLTFLLCTIDYFIFV